MIDSLYRDLIIDHYKFPRNFRRIESATVVKEGDNPLCGDKITLYLKVENGKVVDVSFEGSGCAISQASTSLLTETVKGKQVEEIKCIVGEFLAMLTEGKQPSVDLGKLLALEGVKNYPMRVKCATLGWHTLEQALKEIG